MKFKLDENIGNRGKVLLESAGHDVSTVLRFPPAKSAGLVILELPTRADPDSILIRLREFLQCFGRSARVCLFGAGFVISGLNDSF